MTLGAGTLGAGTLGLPADPEPPPPFTWPVPARHADRLTWYPVGGTPLDVHLFQTGPERHWLQEAVGLYELARQPTTTDLVGAMGVHLNVMQHSARMVTLDWLTEGRDAVHVRQRLAEVAAAFATGAVPAGAQPPLGVLETHLDGRPELSIDAHPTDDTPRVVKVAPHAFLVTVRLLCPFPLWRGPAVLHRFDATGSAGLEFPVDHPMEARSANAARLIVNEASAASPYRLRITGEGEGFTFTNERTGELFHLAGELQDGEALEVDVATATITHVDAAGVRTDAFPLLDLATSDLWLLQPGEQVVRFAAAINVSARATMTVQPLHASV